MHVVSERLGHASVAMTLEIYAHVLPHMQQDAAATLGALLFKRWKQVVNLSKSASALLSFGRSRPRRTPSFGICRTKLYVFVILFCVT